MRAGFSSPEVGIVFQHVVYRYDSRKTKSNPKTFNNAVSHERIQSKTQKQRQSKTQKQSQIKNKRSQSKTINNAVNHDCIAPP